MITLRLPVPPSLNGAYRNVSAKERARAAAMGKTVRGRRKTVAYHKWLKEADAWYLTQKRDITPMRGKLVVEIKVPVKARADCSNLLKLTEDYLVSRELTGDDKHNHKVSIERADVDCCVVTVTARDEGNCT